MTKVASLVLLTIGCFAVSGCDQPTNTPVASQSLREIKADLVYYGMTSYLTAQGVRQGQVQADTAYMFKDSSVVKLRGMHVIFYGDNGQERAVVTAERGRLYSNSQRMEAYGHVVLIIPAVSGQKGSQTRTIRTAVLHYDPNRDQIWSDSATIMVEGSDTTRGTSFKSDMNFTNVQVQNPRGAIGGKVF